MRYLTFKEKVCVTKNYLHTLEYYYSRRLKHLYNAFFDYLEWIINPTNVNKFKYISDLMLFNFEKKFYNKLIGDNRYLDIFKKMNTKDEEGNEVNFCRCKNK